MAVTDTVSTSAKTAAPAYRFTPAYLIAGLGGLTLIAVFYRAYIAFFGLEAGLDATSAEFQTYWWNLLMIQLPVIGVANIACWVYLLMTRETNMSAITPETEMKRYFYFALWLLAYTFAVAPVGVWTETDAVWHNTVLRDTAFGPTHIILFYGMIPIYLFFGIGSFIYAMTRIPAFARGISFMHVLAVVGPFLILANVGFNEWGHAFWLTEELFSHPLHWGFVILGVTALALAGVAAQITMRLVELFPVVFKNER